MSVEEPQASDYSANSISYTEEDYLSDDESENVITVIHLDSVSLNSDNEFEDLSDLEVEGGDKFEEDSALTDFIGRAFSLSALDKKKKKPKGSSGSSGSSNSTPPVRRFLSHQESNYVDLDNIPASEDHVYFDIDEVRKAAEKDDEKKGRELAESVYMTMGRGGNEDDYVTMSDMAQKEDNIYMNINNNNQSQYQNLPAPYPEEHIYASLKRPKTNNSKEPVYENFAVHPPQGRLHDGYVTMEKAADKRKYENLPQHIVGGDEGNCSEVRKSSELKPDDARRSDYTSDIDAHHNQQPYRKTIKNGFNTKKINDSATKLKLTSNEDRSINASANEKEESKTVGEIGGEFSNTAVNPSEVCYSCKQVIADSALFEVNDTFFHTSCLKCSLCHKLVSGMYSVF